MRALPKALLAAIAVPACLAIWLGGGRSPAASEPRAAQDELRLGPLDADDRLAGLWWTRLGEQSTAVLHLGPSLESHAGRLRPWSLVVHLPGTPEPLTCIPGLAFSDDAAPIGASGAFFEVELQPRPGLTWGDVLEDGQIEASVTGIH